MGAYIVTRLALAGPMLLGITLAVFMAVRFLPGDVVDQLAGTEEVSPEFRQRIEERYSLNDGMPQQYVEWLGELATGDLGTSIFSKRPVTEEFSQRIPVSVQLGVMALLFSWAISLPIGVVSAVRQNSLPDYVGRSFAIILIAVPNFWLGALVITYGFQWFGWTPPLRFEDFWDAPVENVKILWVPAIILGAGLGGEIMRLTRSMMLEVLRQDYVRTAMSKGLSERTVVVRHAFRNALIPVISIVGVQIPTLIGGTVIVEGIFSIPGMGSYLLTSIEHRDYPVVQAIVLLSAIVVIGANLLVDVLYAVIDPRIKYSQ